MLHAIKRLKPGLGRQLAAAAFALALAALGVLIALHAMQLDGEVHRRYETALTLSQLSLEMQQSAAEVRLWHGRQATARFAPQPATAAPGSAALETSLSQLKTRFAQVQELALTAHEREPLLRAANAVNAIETLGRQSPDSTIALDNAAIQSQFETLDNALGQLVAVARDRALQSASQAEESGDLARMSLIAFGLITMVLVGLAAWLAIRAQRSNRRLVGRLGQMAHEDALTGITNRRGLDATLPIEFERARHTRAQLTIAMLDLDHFKKYNDRRGHGAGDALLRGAGQAWLQQLRPTDVLARYGGEEFTVILPGCNAEQASLLVDRLRPLVPDRQTFSAGIASWDFTESASELLQRADTALLQAKKTGRNRTMIAGHDPQVNLPLRVA